MTPEPELHPTQCAICHVPDNAAEVYPANFSPQDLNAEVFSARRLPDRVHYRIVKCRTCGLVRSDPIADASLLERLYAQSTFDYGVEVKNLQTTYGRYLRKLESHGAVKGELLEIGCGNGFFLDVANEQGYRRARGVEPSSQAAAMAEERHRGNVLCDVMRPGLFAPETFDTICLFQVFDHITAPDAMLRECWNVLKPGGLVLCLNHNVRSVSARLMGEASPIIDIEHTYLYSPATMTRIFSDAGFTVAHAGCAWNHYSLRYFARLLPLPKRLKASVLAFLSNGWLGSLSISLPLGNLWVVARKDAKHGASIAGRTSTP